jgi:hypothetical protein
LSSPHNTSLEFMHVHALASMPCRLGTKRSPTRITDHFISVKGLAFRLTPIPSFVSDSLSVPVRYPSRRHSVHSPYWGQPSAGGRLRGLSSSASTPIPQVPTLIVCSRMLVSSPRTSSIAPQSTVHLHTECVPQESNHGGAESFFVFATVGTMLAGVPLIR